MGYNGWTNWSTWNMYQWTGGSDEVSYLALCEIADEFIDGEGSRDDCVNQMREYCENGSHLEHARQEINGEPNEGVDMIDWSEFAEAFLDR